MMSIEWSAIGVGCVLTAAVHPFTYVKVLIQLGHEPLTPSSRKSIMLENELQYPNAIEYLMHIQELDGWLGLYRGIIPRVCSNGSTSITYSLISCAISSDGKGFYSDQGITFNYNENGPQLSSVCEQMVKETFARCVSIVVSQPFHVISIRCMAQFVGGETIYNNMFCSAITIYQDEGFSGYFAGIVPRLACEITSLWICNIFTHLVNSYLLNDSSGLKSLRQYNRLVVSYLAQRFTYPLSVVSTVMAVNGTKLKAGNTPFIPKYDSWTTCLRDLYKLGLSDRGSSLFFRKAAMHISSATRVHPMPPTLRTF